MKALQRSLEDKFASVGIIATLSSILLLLLPIMYVGGYSSYASLRYYFFGTIALILGLATMWTWFRARWIANSFFKSWYGYGLLAYLFVFILVSLTSIDRVTSFFSTFQRTDGAVVVFFLTLFTCSTYTLLAIRGKRAVRDLFKYSVIGATIVSLFIMLSPDGVSNWFTMARGGATIGNSSVAASYILFNIFFALFLLITSVKRKVWWGIVTAVLVLSPLFLNWQLLLGNVPYNGVTSLIGTARGAVLGLVVALLIGVFAWLLFQKNKVQKMLGIGLISLLFIGAIFSGVKLLDQNTEIHKNFANIASETRYIFWDISEKGFHDRPIVGWGPGTFDTVYHSYFDPKMLLIPGGGEMWVDRTHNIFFETLVSGGVLLVAALLLFFVSIVAGLVKAVRRGDLSSLEGSLLLAAFSGWLIQAQFIFESVSSLLMLFLLAAISYTFSITIKEGERSAYITNTTKSIFIVLSAIAIVIFVFTIVLPHKKDRVLYKTYNENLPARTSLWQNLNNISPMGDGYDTTLTFNKVYDAYNKQVSGIKSGDPELKNAALEELDEVSQYLYQKAKQRPGDYGVHLIGAQLFYTRMLIASSFTGQSLLNAQELTDSAIKLSPTDPQVYWLSAQLKSVERDFSGAKEMLEYAFVLEPSLETTHQFILQLARNTKDIDYYQSSLIRARQSVSGFNPNF